MLSTIYSQAYNEAMDMIDAGVANNQILAHLVLAAEKALEYGSVVSIMRLDESGLLRNASSPKLPEDYLQAIDGLKPNANVGTCAAAAATGEFVFTPSFYADNKWAELRHLPTALGFVGAWSCPIKDNENRVLGTFGTYFRKQRKPTSEEIKGTLLLASAAAKVLSKSMIVS